MQKQQTVQMPQRKQYNPVSYPLPNHAEVTFATMAHPQSVPLWQQLQATATVLQAVQAGESGSKALQNLQNVHGIEAAILRPAVQSLVFNAWRWLGTAQALRRKLVHRPAPPFADALLVLALTQLCLDDETHPPAYDAFTLVNQTVEAAKQHPEARHSSAFINACLRRFLRDKAQFLAEIANGDDLVAHHNHPRWWLKRLRVDHPNDWQSIVDTNNSRPPMTLRVNAASQTTVSAYAQQLQHELGAQSHPITHPLTPHALRLQHPVPVAMLPDFANGKVSVQDAAAQMACALLLGSQSDDGKHRWMNGENAAINPISILDACAAPGGKTAHLLEYLLTHRGTLAGVTITAMDIDAKRCESIHQNTQRCLSSVPSCDIVDGQIHVVCADAALPETWLFPMPQLGFDAILLDAPCTASGIVRRHPDIRWLRRESDIEQLAVVQRHLLQTLWPMVKVGGRLLYCTCSVFRAEGSGQIKKFMLQFPNAKVLPAPQHLLPNPQHDGFFYALFEKTEA